jgi:3-oxoadipate enol-lactonase
VVNTSGSVAVDGCVLRYWVSGTGPPVLLTHGAGADHIMFDAQVEALTAACYQAITWDMRGHGLSRPSALPFTAHTAVADLGALPDHLDIDTPVLVGQSLGGNLSQTFTKLSPERVRALVVIGAAWNSVRSPRRTGPSSSSPARSCE